MDNNLVVLILAAFSLMGSPGPATLSVAAVGSAFGAAHGRRYLAGIILGTTGVVMTVASGITGLVLAQPKFVIVISVFAGGYILYLAYKIATAPVISKSGQLKKVPSFYAGFVLAISNPKAFAAISAVYSGSSIVPNDLVLDGLVKTTVLSMVVVVVNSSWLVFGAALSSVLSDPFWGRVANLNFALLLVVSVAMAFI